MFEVKQSPKNMGLLLESDLVCSNREMSILAYEEYYVLKQSAEIGPNTFG